ncbi:hypothetical protein D3C80_1206900 [compost metagenome]
MIPKNPAYPPTSTMVPMRKLRCTNRRKLTTGCRSVSSQITNTARNTTETRLPTMMNDDSNQSRSLPLSSTTCKAPTPIIRVSRPM